MKKKVWLPAAKKFLGILTSLILLIGSAGISGAAEYRPAYDNPFFTLDETDKTIGDIYEGKTAESLKQDFLGGWSASVWMDGCEVTDGALQENMTVRIYREEQLYGEYRIDKLLPVQPQLFSSNGYGFCSPFENRVPLDYVTSEYGMRDGKLHGGIDLAWGGIDGTPIRAVKSGTVYIAQSMPNTTGWGNYVRIDHGGNLHTLYAHMKYTPLVSNGQYVEQGQVIGYVGQTGDAQGSHLHFEVWTSGSRVNPRPYLVDAGEPDGTDSLQSGRVVAGDFDGDGKDDIATMYYYGSDNGNIHEYALHVFRSDGTQFETCSWWLTNTGYNATAINGRMVAGDFYGDGKDDIADMYY